MTDEQLYALLVWVLKAAGGAALLTVVVYVFARAYTSEFPEAEGRGCRACIEVVRHGINNKR